MMLFVAVPVGGLTRWAQGGSFQPGLAYAVTPSMSAAFGFGPSDTEDAEHTALHIAGLTGLLYFGTRLVAVVEASGQPVPGSEFGEVQVGTLPWSAVTALFSDDVSDATAALHERLMGRSLPTVWEEDEVADFLAEHELLWHGPGEWCALAEPCANSGADDEVARDSDEESFSRYVSTFVSASLDLRATSDGGLKRTWESPTPSFFFLIGDVQLGAYIQTDDRLPLNPGEAGRRVVLVFWAPVARELATPGRQFTLVYGTRQIGAGTIGQPAR